MTATPRQPDPHQDPLSPADAELLDRLLAGDQQPDRSTGVGRVLDLLGRWDTPQPGEGLTDRTLMAILASEPTPLCAQDAQALDAMLALREQGLAQGPMPAGTRERTERLTQLLALLDRSVKEPVPRGLGDRTLQTIEKDRQQQRRLASTASGHGTRHGTRWGSAGISIRQIATTAALLMMVLSVLLPVLDKSRRDAMIAQCEANLAGLGVDLQQFANDSNLTKASATDPRLTKPGPTPPAVFSHLSEFASSQLDGTNIPAQSVSLFVLLNERKVDSDHLACPAADPKSQTASYNGQNPIAGGPLRVFLHDNERPVFADTNPLYRLTPNGLVRDTEIPGMTRSKNHDGMGQNVLINDGSVQWKVRPAVIRRGVETEDNIWLYQRDNNAEDEPDIFLTPLTP